MFIIIIYSLHPTNSNGRYYVTAHDDNSVKVMICIFHLVLMKSTGQLQFPNDQ